MSMRRHVLAFLSFVPLAASPVLAQGGVLHYCTPGATGAQLSASGSASFTVNGGMGDLTLAATGIPAGGTGLFLMGSGITQAIPFGQGFRCLAGPVYRLRAVTAPPGQTSVAHTLNYLDGASAASRITPGSAWTFQFWFRAGASFDLTDALQIVFGPPEPLLGATTLARGTQSGHPLAWTVEGGIEVVDDAAQWAALWAQHDTSLPQTPPPFVDFTQERVLAVFAGWRPTSGHEITVRALDLSVAALDVGTLENAPGVNCNVLFVITQPYHFVRVPRVEPMVLRTWSRAHFAPPCL